MADIYTSLYDEKINDPDLRPLRMGYKTQKIKIQEDFLAGYDCGYEAGKRSRRARSEKDL